MLLVCILVLWFFNLETRNLRHLFPFFFKYIHLNLYYFSFYRVSSELLKAQNIFPFEKGIFIWEILGRSCSNMKFLALWGGREKATQKGCVKD